MLEKFLFVNDLDAVFDFQDYDLQKIHEELDSERNTWLKRYQLINLHSHFHVILGNSTYFLRLTSTEVIFTFLFAGLMKNAFQGVKKALNREKVSRYNSHSEAYSEISQTSKMENFCVNSYSLPVLL